MMSDDAFDRFDLYGSVVREPAEENFELGNLY